jgi:hypothetical protein
LAGSASSSVRLTRIPFGTPSTTALTSGRATLRAAAVAARLTSSSRATAAFAWVSIATRGIAASPAFPTASGGVAARATIISATFGRRTLQVEANSRHVNFYRRRQDRQCENAYAT